MCLPVYQSSYPYKYISGSQDKVLSFLRTTCSTTNKFAACFARKHTGEIESNRQIQKEIEEFEYIKLPFVPIDINTT